ncbi:IS110 family transposase [Micromonospora halophytica]|uniref:IS110 family transposase n=1 Tax=Micromonospora halophytica TaxID=47864 RepID=UPI000A8AE778|nr:IS110 family transposase [Micromonospora halophytica]
MILGVDTHKDVHVAAVVSIHGVLLGSRSFPTTAEGYRTMLDWAAALGRVRQAGVEGTHSYGSRADPPPAERRNRRHRGQPAGQGPPSPPR